MNLPNKLTLIRIMIIPIIIIVSVLNVLKIDLNIIDGGLSITVQNLIILVLFAIASFTDFLDGHLARKNNLVTDFGKFMDPLADKLLVMSALIILLEQGKLNVFGIGLGFVVTIILAREFMVTGIRLLALQSNNNVIAASKLGKAKTATQMVMIILMFFDLNIPANFDYASLIKTIIILIPFALTVISGVDYFWKNRQIILQDR